jgi:imidazolonepropionase-like amidohydrolase
VVRCGTLIDGTGADPAGDALLVIREGRIVEVRRAGAGDTPRGARVVDAGGLTVLPGLIDAHVHLMSRPQSIEQRLLTPYSLNVAQALAHAGETLAAGVTTVRDAGGAPRGVKLAIERGLFPGPRVRVSVTGLSQTGGHGDQTMPAGVDLRLGTPDHPLPEHPWGVVDGVDAVRRATRQVLRAGADQVKLMTSGGVMSAGSEPGATGFTLEEIGAAVYEARAAGKKTMAHAQATQGIRNAVEGGVDSIEHGIFLDEEVADLMVRRGTYLVPTLVAPVWVIRRAEREPGSVPPYALRKAREVKARHLESFRLALEKGVAIAMGTDSGVGPHGQNAEELALMVGAGMTPMAAIVASTRSAAACLDLAGEVGTLEPGQRADLIAVDGDPLADIAVLQDRRRLRVILKDGREIRRADEDLAPD